MKVRVVEAFIDKETSEPYNCGDIFETDDKERITELRKGGYLASRAEPNGGRQGDNPPGDAQTVTDPSADPPASTQP